MSNANSAAAAVDTLLREYRLAQPIVVTAVRAPQPAIAAVRSIESVDAARIERQQAHTPPEALLEANGVFVQQTNRGAGAPILRGLIGPQNLLLVDGVRFNTSTFRTGPNQYLSTLDLPAFCRLEVVRGPSSVLYGEGAMGGVVQALTQDAASGITGSWGARATTWFQSADRATGGSAQLALRSDESSWLLGGSLASFGTLQAASDADIPFSDFESGNWHAKTQWRIAPKWSFTAAYLGTRVTNAGRTDQLGRGDLRFYDNDDHLTYLRLKRTAPHQPYELAATLSYHRSQEHVDRMDLKTNPDGTLADLGATLRLDPANVTRKIRYDDIVDVIGGSGEVGLGLLEQRIRVQGGVDVYQEFVDSHRADGKAANGFVFVSQPRGNFSDGSRYTTLGAFAHARGRLIELGKGSLNLDGGLRASRFTAFAPNVPAVGEVDDTFAGVVGAVGLQYLCGDRLNIYGSAMQGFRAPNLQEKTVLGNTGSKFEIPNGDLQPERSNMVEIGAKADIGRLRVAAAWYYNLLEDVIDERSATWLGQNTVEGKPVIQRVNAAEGLYRGIEASFDIRVGDFFTHAAIAAMRGDVRSLDGNTYPARRIPPPFGTVGVRYQPTGGRGWGEFAVRWADSQSLLHPSDSNDLRVCETAPFSGILRDPCSGTPAWATLHLRGGWRFTQAFSLGLALDNLSDQQYRTHGSGLDGPGFDLRSSVEFRY